MTGTLAVIVLAACGGSTQGAASSGASDSGGAPRTLTVFAAASLTDVYGEINTKFEAAHPGVTVTMTNGGSNDLVTQIAQGAPADVLATADEKTMGTAIDQGLASSDPRTFATNALTIAVPTGNPAKITDLADLAKPGVKVVRCAAEVPCGAVTDQILTDTGVTLTPVSEEGSVTDVLGKVTSGDADAGLVYATDVQRSQGRAEAVAIPAAADHLTSYPIVVVKGSHDAELAQEYTDFVLSETGRTALQDAGFGTP